MTKSTRANKRKTASAKPSARKTTPRAKRATKAKVSRRTKPSIGRPKVTGEELLYMLFKEDFHARQIFDYLRVETVKDLEQYSPQQIIKRLSQPITETVKRIRHKLAEKNRYLADDIEFAVEVREQAKG